ncbi:hypothetical protein KEM56_000648 [Ascosphaera pollenicola]|nr:hypothetical protein KEM56_000648 [Ascosphaera pollenicola]
MVSSELQIRKNRKREDYPFVIKCQTRWADNDNFAHLNNAVYLQLIDTVVNCYLLKHAGVNPFLAREAQGMVNTSPPQIFFVANVYCDYFAPVSFPDILDLGLRVIKIGNSSVTYEAAIFKEEEDKVKMVGGYTHVFVDKMTQRPVKGGMHPQFREALEVINLGMDGKNTVKAKL